MEAIQRDVWMQALEYFNLLQTPNHRQETPDAFLDRINQLRVIDHLKRDQGSPRRNKIAETFLEAIAMKAPPCLHQA